MVKGPPKKALTVIIHASMAYGDVKLWVRSDVDLQVHARQSP